MKMNLSSLEVARRELETAVSLFFKNGDPVSIHTLACASQEILEVIAKKQGSVSMQKELLDLLLPDKRKFVADKLRNPQNFFKHVTGKTIDFNPELSQYFIWDACQLYEKITGEKVKSFQIFHWWFGIKHKEFFPKLDKLMWQKNIDFEIEDRLTFYSEASKVYDTAGIGL